MNTLSSLTFALLAIGVTIGDKVSAATKNEPVTLKTVVILTAPLSLKEGDSLPSDIRELALPSSDKVCGGLILIPETKLIRGDLTDLNESTVLPDSRAEESSIWDKFAKAVGKNPTVEVLRNRMGPRIDSVHVTGDWIRLGDKAVTLADLATLAPVRDADLRLVLVGKADHITEADVQAVFPELPETYLVKDSAVLNKQLVQQLCSGGTPEAKSNIEGKSVVVIYKPKLTGTEGNEGTATRKTACNEQLLNEGIQFISMARDKRDAKLRRADLENAFRMFDRTVQEAQANNACCAKGLMNRGLVRNYLNEPNLALEDLKEAEHCDSNDAGVLYNLATHYAKQKQIDYSLQALDKALEKGFSNCNTLRTDTDLANVRVSPKFRDALEKHKLFCKM